MSSQSLKARKNDENDMGRLVYFIEALYRVFKIGIYYPLGHVVLDQAASKCIQQLREVTTGLKSACIEVDRDKLLFETVVLPPKTVAVSELCQLLSSMGIRLIELERGVTHKQILQFSKTLLTWRSELERAKNLTTLKINELPSTIRVEQVEFVVEETRLTSDESLKESMASVDEVCVALTQQGLSKPQVEQCRSLILKLSQPKKGKPIDIKGFPNATWKDVQDLLYKIVTSAYSSTERRFESIAQNDINIISSILGSFEKGLGDQKAKQTVKLLVSHLKGSASEKKLESQQKESKKAPPKVKARPVENLVSSAEIKKYIYDNNIPLKVLERIVAVDRSEELSIYLQLLEPELDQNIAERIERKIEGMVAGSLTVREKETLIAGIKHLADGGNRQSFNRFLRLVLQRLRAEKSSLSFIVELWSTMPYAMHVTLWPFVVNELLIVGLQGGRESFFEVTEIASHMHADGMKVMKDQLERMEACSKKQIAPTVFRPSHLYSYQLFAFLFNTSVGPVIAEKVLDSLAKDPQDDLIKAVAPILDLENVVHLSFLKSYLEQAHLDNTPLSLKIGAGEIILEFLTYCEGEQREVDWLPATIETTPTLAVNGMDQMLQNIINDKKMGLVYLWPRGCRKAASNARKNMKRKI